MICAHLEKTDPRVRRTRKLLQDALDSLLYERDFASISVQDVAERATVNRATFYAHYPDKQALLDSLVQAKFQRFMLERFPELPNLDASGLTAMATAIVVFVGQMVSDCPEATKGLESVIDAALQEEVFGLFRHWLAKSESHPFAGHKEELVALVLSTSVLGAAFHWVRSQRKFNPDALAKALVKLLLPADPAVVAR